MHRRGDSSHPSAEPPAAPDQVCQHEDSSHEEELHQQVVPRKGGRRPGPGKPLKLSKKGKEKRKGKGGMATIWQKMQVFREHERLVKAGTVKNPEKYMLQEKLFKWHRGAWLTPNGARHGNGTVGMRSASMPRKLQNGSEKFLMFFAKLLE